VGKRVGNVVSGGGGQCATPRHNHNEIQEPVEGCIKELCIVPRRKVHALQWWGRPSTKRRGCQRRCTARRWREINVQ